MLTPEQLDVCAGIALLYGDEDQFSARLAAAMRFGNREEAEHVSAVMITLLYGKDVEGVKLAAELWSQAFT